MLLLAHWSGCLQYMVPYLQGFPEDSWVAINHLQVSMPIPSPFPQLFGFQNAPVGTAYTWSLFKSLSHMLCIGYGRFPPMNVSDAWLTIISMMIGASFYALFIGHISSHVLTANSPSRLYQQKVRHHWLSTLSPIAVRCSSVKWKSTCVVGSCPCTREIAYSTTSLTSTKESFSTKTKSYRNSQTAYER